MLSQFRWIDGHADVWAVFRDPSALSQVVAALAEPYRDGDVTTVVGIESRGFLLGGAVAVALGVGFAAVVDGLPDDRRAGLPPVHRLVRQSEL